MQLVTIFVVFALILAKKLGGCVAVELLEYAFVVLLVDETAVHQFSAQMEEIYLSRTFGLLSA